MPNYHRDIPHMPNYHRDIPHMSLTLCRVLHQSYSIPCLSMLTCYCVCLSSMTLLTSRIYTRGESLHCCTEFSPCVSDFIPGQGCHSLSIALSNVGLCTYTIDSILEVLNMTQSQSDKTCSDFVHQVSMGCARLSLVRVE